MTPFKLLLNLSGLSQREASDYLNISKSTVDKLSREKFKANEGIIKELRNLIAKQHSAANKALALIHEQAAMPTYIEIGYPANDREAQTLGWPSVGAWSAMTARIISQCSIPIVFVPGGSIISTAAAAETAAHDRLMDLTTKILVGAAALEDVGLAVADPQRLGEILHESTASRSGGVLPAHGVSHDHTTCISALKKSVSTVKKRS
jgi:hypothetical protein